MKRVLALGLSAMGIFAGASAEVTLDNCLDAAHENYPLIKQYELLTATEDIDLAEINKGWLPQLGVYGQGTVQNVVPSFPAALSNVMQQMGADVKGLGKLQYKVGADLIQPIWDGGASKTRREIVRKQTEVDRANLDVEMYGVRDRIESLYFGILLLEQQIEQTESAMKVYDANLGRIKSMVANGVAMSSDAEMVEAQRLTLKQQLSQAKSALKGYRTMLSIFTGLDLANETLKLPEAKSPTSMKPLRPEQELMARQIDLNYARRSLADVAAMPKIGLFAQAYYGYPGIDYFKAMMSRDLTMNIVAGVKVTWNIDSFYTKKDSKRRIGLAISCIDAQQETFLFNNSMQSASQIEEINGLETVMADDARIVELRSKVRYAAESQLNNGVIDATALITKINDETQAKLTSAYHTIQYIKAIYKLKNILNR